MEAKKVVEEFAWQPQAGPQTAYIHCPIEEILFGGSRGGGKTDGSLGKAALKALRYKDGFYGYFFRRELTQLDAAIHRSKEIYGKLDAEYVAHKKTWTFPGGGSLLFRHLDQDSDAEKYQGSSASDLFFEELTNFPDPKPVLKLKAILRSARGVPTQFHSTANPGGPGHLWVRARYIDPAPLGWKVIAETDDFTGLTSQRIYIPSRITDNKLLLLNDPNYVARLAQTGSEQLVRAWLDGDWHIIDGAFFDCWSTKQHVIRTVEMPEWWLRFRAMDWGSATPFCVQWWAIAGEDWVHPDGHLVPEGAMICYREWYGSKNHNNVGLKLPAENIAAGILAREHGDPPITYGVIDPKAWSQDGGPSHAERMARASNGKLMFRRADNKRIARYGAMGGWDVMRQRLYGSEHEGVRLPMMFFFDNCVDAIRTIPMVQHDPDNPENVMEGGEDHEADTARYAAMSRPWSVHAPKSEQTSAEFVERALSESIYKIPLDQLWSDREKERGGYQRV